MGVNALARDDQDSFQCPIFQLIGNRSTLRLAPKSRDLLWSWPLIWRGNRKYFSHCPQSQPAAVPWIYTISSPSNALLSMTTAFNSFSMTLFLLVQEIKVSNCQKLTCLLMNKQVCLLISASESFLTHTTLAYAGFFF